MSHFFNPSLADLGESATIAINQRSQLLSAQGRSLTSFGFGESPFPPPPPLREALTAQGRRKQYLPSLGLPDLRQAIADYYRERFGFDWHPDTVAVAPGSKMLLYLIQMVFDVPLLLLAPAWVSYRPQAKLLGKEVNLLTTEYENSWQIDPDQLAAWLAAQRRTGYLMILNAPNNPSGQNVADLERLAELCDRYDIIVVSDEIYAPLSFSGYPRSLAHVIPERVIVSGGLSKAWSAGGYRLGFCAAGSAFKECFRFIATAASETYTTASAPVQYAALSVWRDQAEACDHYMQQCAAVLQQGLALAHRKLLSAGLRCHPAAGGFYLFPDFSLLADRLSAVRSGRYLARALLDEADVASLPAEDFGLEDVLALRLAVVNYDGEQALAALQTGEDLALHQCFAPVREGCQRIHDWLQKQ